MSASAQDFDFDEYDKPGAERSRRRRGEDDTLESDLEDELLEEDWLSSKKNPLEVSDEELNDDLLQSDDEDINTSGQDVCFDASYGMDPSYDQQDNSQEADYTDDVVNLGAEGCEGGDEEEEEYQQEGEEEYAEKYIQEDTTEMAEDQINYTEELAEDDDGYQDEVLDLQISEPIDGEFQDEDYQTSYASESFDEHGAMEEQHTQVADGGEQQDEEDTTEEPHICDTEEGENETLPEDETKEESNEEEEDDEESGRMRFKSERKDGAILRLAEASSKRRNIPETLELSEKAKKDLMEFEEQERQKRQNRYSGRGRGGGRGSRGRGGFPSFGMADFRGGKRGRMHDHMLPLLGNMNIQPSSRMPSPYHQQLQSHPHHPSRPRGPPPFQEHGRPIPQQPLQPLIPHHMAHRSPPLRPQMEPPRMMSSPPPNFPQHHQQQPMQPKNIHINPHFRGPAQSSVQVPLMPPAQSQPRPAVGPQRFPGPGDFQQHMPGNFGQPQRPPHHMEPLRNQPPQGPQDREPLFMGECGDSARFPGQHMFDHQGPSPLMNSSNNLHHQQQLSGQGHMGFGPPGPPFNQPGQGQLGIFQRESPRPNLPPHQGHQGMVNLNQQGGPPNQPRPFMGPRQPFGQQGNIFPSPPVQFGMQGLMHGPPASQLPHHDPMLSHPMHQQQQHHRQELPHHQQQQMNLGEPRPMMRHGQNPFHGHGGPRQMTPRPQNPQQRNMSNRQRMNAPVSKQQQRNSNLRELPVAPGNTSMNSARPSLTSPTANIKPVARTTQGMRPGQNTQLMSGGGRGRGQVAEKTESQPGGAGRMAAYKEMQSTPSSVTPQDPDEDEETRQYRLKIEEQKRLREEILKRKEMRRQMQAGVRKKELLERLNVQTSTHSQPVQPHQQTQHPEQQPPTTQQPEQKRQQQLQAQQQRQFPQGTQSLNHALKTSNHGNTITASSVTQTLTPRPNVKTRLQMVKNSTEQQQTPSPGSEQQQPEQNQQQLRRNSTLQSVNRPNTQVQDVPVTNKNTPVTPSVNQGLTQAQGLKPGAKRTVMQRAKNSGIDSQQVPQKVRVVKLSGPSGKGPEDSSGPVQQQGTWQESLLNQDVQRKVTVMGPQQHGPNGPPQDSHGGMSNPQQSRVVVSGRGRGRGAGQLGRGRGAGQVGRGRPVSTRQRGADNLRCTVSIEGLSSSTTEFQLKNLLRSIGPIEMFKMLPQQRKAIATFSNSQHAASFQMSFHRHMIDLSHIDVSLIDG
ncbi:RNA-binding protein 33 isoform X2 [Melanotaenia boesemani]|uniref:RNA-binding protein 33 isoform X2 n=1 Tax=Melanotaenia boesemani TaxID=1250792 RepID=UPI001C04E9B1|nr:RNA-binding protein 33 isoform X2 [Melanotaenia boesemani]